MSGRKDYQTLVSRNQTNLFSRELFLYALGDIKLPQPLSLRVAGYVFAFLMIWSLPIYLIFGINFNFFFLLFWLGVPVGVGILASKPIWGGVGMLTALTTMAKYLTTPKGFTDNIANNDLDKRVYNIKSEVWISRRRELDYLTKLAEAEGDDRFSSKKRPYLDEDGNILDSKPKKAPSASSKPSGSSFFKTAGKGGSKTEGDNKASNSKKSASSSKSSVTKKTGKKTNKKTSKTDNKKEGL